MRLQEFRIHKLFGIFDHVVPLNLEDRITIIHGPNGYGKTAILRMIHGIFQSQYEVLRELPFESIELEFDDQRVLTITKGQEHSEELLHDDILLKFTLTGEKKSFVYPNISNERSRNHIARAIRNYNPELERIGNDRYLDQTTNKILDFDSMIDRYGDRLEARSGISLYKKPKPEWLSLLQSTLDVHLIRANRLEKTIPSFRHSLASDLPIHVVSMYSGELTEEIQATLAQYAETSQSLDRTFPTRLVTSSSQSALTMQKINTRLSELEVKRNELMEAGLLDKEEMQPHFQFANSLDGSKIDVLSVYIEDASKKLGVFDTLYEKINLFQKMLNKRFQYKTVSIDKHNGIVFSTPDGKQLSPSSLSSGEQHEVVLLYQLLFKVKPDSLILIDEPELSLHIAWQEQFLTDFQQITKLSGFDVLIATHSPQIISNRWDLTVELQGPAECKSS